MTRIKYASFIGVSILFWCIIGVIHVFAQDVSTSQNAQIIDRVAAVVGNEVILLSEVQERVRSEMMNRSMDENTSSKELQLLLNEVLNGMIDDRLLLVKAVQDSIEIDSALVGEDEKREYQRIRDMFSTDSEYEQALQEFGMTDQQIRHMIREMMIKNQLQQIIMQSVSRGISVTPQDMEAWVAANADTLGEMPTQYRLSHILIYPQVSEERKETIRAKLADIRRQIFEGADFAEMARQYSEDPGSKDAGGDLGYFSRNEMVTEFADAAFALSLNEISGIIETQFGFHLIKVEDVRGDEIRARHILLILDPNEEDNQKIIALLQSIREKIITGKMTFDDMAREYSEDVNSKDLGGRLQWLTRNNIVPEFMEQADSLEVGEISEPFKTMYGYHLLRLDNIKPAHKLNVRDDSQIIRDMVMSLKSEAELERILTKLRDETYIRIALEEN